VTLVDQNNWHVGLGGFVEFDSFYDTTRSFVETVGDGPVARKGTFDGNDGRTQFSIRNTRLSLNILAPVVDEWKTRGYIETDFLGYDPSANANGTSNTVPNSEAGFYSNPTLRIRHAYMTAEKDGYQILVGQTWTLFGWQPTYDLATVSVAPVAGTLYQRSERIGVIKSVSMSDTQSLAGGLSLQRPTQRDGRIPNVDLGVKWTIESRRSGYADPKQDIKTQPMSFGLSGTYRNFDYADSNTAVNQTTSVSAFALAANALVPIIASNDGKDVSHTLTATGEFTVGKGYGDEFPSWTGGLSQLSTASTPANGVNLDPGLGGYNNQGGFELAKLRTWNTQLQYHFEGTNFMTLGYGQLWSSNIADFTASAGASGLGKLYDRSEAKFVNFIHDFTAQLRLALEFDQFTTHYVSDSSADHDNRYMVTAYYRF
jgi:hypothetical protein